jgi:LEA14-like dessication related protein
MKKFLPIITVAAAAYGVIFWLRRKTAAGQNLRYEVADIGINTDRIIESNFARIYFNTRLRLLNDESVSVNVNQINLNAYVGNRPLGKILSNIPFIVPARSSELINVETSFSSGQLVLYIIDLVQNGFQFNEPISVEGYIETNFGRILVNFTKEAPEQINGYNILNNIQGNC